MRKAHEYDYLADGFMPSNVAYPKGALAAKRALALDSTSGEAYSAAALINANGEWDWPRARHDFERAHALSPNEPWAYEAEALYWWAMRRPERVIQSARQALMRDPVSPLINYFLVTALAFSGQPDSAIAQDHRLAEIAPGFAYVDAMVGYAYLLKGMNAEAEKAFKGIEPKLGYRSAGLGVLYARTGRRQEAAAIARSLESQSRKTYIVPEFIAEIYAALGDRDRMYFWLEKGVATHSGFAPFLGEFFPVDAYRQEPRFKALLKRVGIAEDVPR